MVEDKIAETSFNLINGSPGLPTFFLWEAPNANVISSSSALFTTSFPNPGVYPITFTVKTDSSCDLITKNITITKNTVNILTLSFFNEAIYPNPAKDILNIKTENYLNTTISIHNALGQVIYNTKMISSNERLNISKYSKGLYYVILENDKNRSLNKLIIK